MLSNSNRVESLFKIRKKRKQSAHRQRANKLCLNEDGRRLVAFVSISI